MVGIGRQTVRDECDRSSRERERERERERPVAVGIGRQTVRDECDRSSKPEANLLSLLWCLRTCAAEGAARSCHLAVCR